MGFLFLFLFFYLFQNHLFNLLFRSPIRGKVVGTQCEIEKCPIILQNIEQVPSNPPDPGQIRGIFCAQSLPESKSEKAPSLVYMISYVQCAKDLFSISMPKLLSWNINFLSPYFYPLFWFSSICYNLLQFARYKV